MRPLAAKESTASAPLQELFDLFAGRHVVCAREARGDDGPGGVGVPDGTFGIPPGEQSVAQSAAEGVARTEPVEDLHLDRWHLHHTFRRLGKDALRSLLHYGESDAEV